MVAAMRLTSCLTAALMAHRVELHIHLDGAISAEELLHAARQRNLSLPGIGQPSSVDDILKVLSGQHPSWHRFDIVNNIVGGDVATLSRVAEAFVARQALNGVAYTEVRYDPMRMARSAYANTSLRPEAAVAAIPAGLAAGTARYGVRAFSLLCAMRGQPAEACDAVADLAARMRSDDPGGVVGLDLAGDELHFNNSEYVACFRRAKERGLRTTVHAGECFGNLCDATAGSALS